MSEKNGIKLKIATVLTILVIAVGALVYTSEKAHALDIRITRLEERWDNIEKSLGDIKVLLERGQE